jgi:hypothetical protein
MRQALALSVFERGDILLPKRRSGMNVRPVVIWIVCVVISLSGCHTMRPVVSTPCLVNSRVFYCPESRAIETVRSVAKQGLIGA